MNPPDEYELYFSEPVVTALITLSLTLAGLALISLVALVVTDYLKRNIW